MNNDDRLKKIAILRILEKEAADPPYYKDFILAQPPSDYTGNIYEYNVDVDTSIFNYASPIGNIFPSAPSYTIRLNELLYNTPQEDVIKQSPVGNPNVVLPVANPSLTSPWTYAPTTAAEALGTSYDFFASKLGFGGNVSQEDRAAEERLVAQCILLDLLPELSTINRDWRYDYNRNKKEKDNNLNTIGMTGDCNYFSSFVHGSSLKGMFLDFTPHQLSSLVPSLKIYKVQQLSDGKTKDYLIPFSTHAAWQNGKTTYGTIEDIFKQERERPMDVGVKSFDWTLEGSNPISSRRDISAKLTLFSNNLNNFVEPFFIYSTDDGDKKAFRYVDLVLRSGTKFKTGKEYNPQYYTIKIKVYWNTTNEDLFTSDEMNSLKANTTTLILTLIDHQFNFAQDGTFTIDLNYRAYFEGLLFQDSADILANSEQAEKILKAREELKVKADAANKVQDEDDDQPNDTKKTQEQQDYDKAYEEYDKLLTETNKQALQNILNSVATYRIAIDQKAYYAYKDAIKTKTNNVTIDNVINYQPEPLPINLVQAKNAAVASALTTTSNPQSDANEYNLTTIVPQYEPGSVYISFFYMGDLFNYVINNTYTKLEDDPNKPKFLFGSALYRNRINPSEIVTTNIMDIPVSVDWFVEWFVANILSQNKSNYMLLYFMRDFASKMINNILSSKCNRTGLPPLKNKFNISNFMVLKNKNSTYTDDLLKKKYNSDEDLQVSQLVKIIKDAKIKGVRINSIDFKDVNSSDIQQYIALYCLDASSPVNVKCEEDLKNGIYHFYFGRDRGLIKNISFTRAQTQGLRELNYVRESNGYDLQQLMTPYDVEVKMIGNNLFINGMMVFINPSGFGRKIGQPNEKDSYSYALKLGGYHTIYRIESSINSNGFETKLKARWVGSGAPKSNILTNRPVAGSVAETGATSQETKTIDDRDVTSSEKSGYNYNIFKPANPNRETGG